jgi:hypothetical protein
VAVEQVAVGGEGKVLDPRHRGEHRHEPRELAPHQGLAAGQAKVGHAHARHHSHQPLDLLEAQDLVAVEPGQAVGRHAVLAAEVAAIGDRDAQVGDLPAVAIDEWLAGHAP